MRTTLLLVIIALSWSSSGDAHAERAALLPARGEPGVEVDLQAVRQAVRQVLDEAGVETLLSDGDECVAEDDCAARAANEAGAAYAVETVVWSGGQQAASGVSVTLWVSRAERYGHGVELDGEQDVLEAAARATREALARKRRGPGPWLEVRGKPEGARVLLDGKALGVMPQAFKVPAGFHRVRVEKPGYQAYDRGVTLPRSVAGHKVLDVQLRPAGEPSLEAAGAPPRDPVQSSKRSVWNYAIGGAAIAIGGVLSVGPLRTAVNDGECRQAEDGRCRRVVDFGAADALQLTGAALLVGGGITVMVWAPLRVSATLGERAGMLRIEGEL